jgi:DNA primase
MVGVIPTTDSKIDGVFQELSKAHPRVLCLVDGDTAGDSYVATLKKLATPPKRILQLPASWTIEDVVGWIAEADEANAVKELSMQLETTVLKAADLVALMKKDTKSAGWKGDIVAYELSINALAENAKCLVRIRTFLEKVAEACTKLGTMPSGWASAPAGTTATDVIRYLP